MEHSNMKIEMNETGPSESEWNTALDEFQCNEPSLTPAYCAALRAQLLGTKSKVLVCTVRQNAQITGLAIAVKGNSHIEFRIGERVLFSVPAKSVSLGGAEPLSASLEAAQSLFDALADINPGLMAIDRLNPIEGYWSAIVTDHIKSRGYRAYFPFGNAETCSVQIGGTWEKYFQSMPSKIRHEITRLTNRINREYGKSGIVVEKYESANDVDRLLKVMQAIDESSWQHKRIRGRIMDFANRKEFLRLLAQKGLLLSYALILNNEPAAFAVGVRYKKRYHIKEIAFNERFKDKSPGKVLLYRILQDTFDNAGISECCLGYGKARYKKEVCNQFNRVSIVWLFKRHSLISAILFFHRMWMRGQTVSGMMLSFIGAKKAVQAWLRRG